MPNDKFPTVGESMEFRAEVQNPDGSQTNRKDFEDKKDALKWAQKKLNKGYDRYRVWKLEEEF